MPSRESHSGRFALGLVVVLVLIAIIAGEFYGFLYVYGFVGQTAAPISEDQQNTPAQAVEQLPSVIGPQFSSLSYPISFTYPEGWTASTTEYSHEGFIVALDEDNTQDVEVGQIIIDHIETSLGLDEEARIFRDQMTKDKFTIVDDGPVSGGGYAISGSHLVTPKPKDGNPYTEMRLTYIYPVPANNGLGAGYVEFNVYDNLNSYEQTLKVLTDYIFPTLRIAEPGQ